MCTCKITKELPLGRVSLNWAFPAEVWCYIILLDNVMKIYGEYNMFDTKLELDQWQYYNKCWFDNGYHPRLYIIWTNNPEYSFCHIVLLSSVGNWAVVPAQLHREQSVDLKQIFHDLKEISMGNLAWHLLTFLCKIPRQKSVNDANTSPFWSIK